MTDTEAERIAQLFFDALLTDEQARRLVQAVKGQTLDKLGEVIGKITNSSALSMTDTKLVLSYVKSIYISREEGYFGLFGPVAQSLIRH